MMDITGKDKVAKNVILDSTVVIFALIVFAIVAIFANQIFSDFTNDITSDTDLSNTSKQEAVDLESRLPSNLDGAFALAFGLLWLVVVVTSFLLDSHPAFFVVSLVLMIGLLIGAGLLSNSYQEFASDSEINAFAEEFPITNMILNNFVIVVLILAGSIAIVQFAKRAV